MADDLLALLTSCKATPAGAGMTTRELCAATGRSEEWVREQLRAAIAAGKVRPVKKVVSRLDGPPTTVSAYEFLNVPEDQQRAESKPKRKR